MADLGWFLDKKVELIDGEIIEMPIAKGPHVMSVHLTTKALEKVFGKGPFVRRQSGLNLGPETEAEPDLAVVVGDVRDYAEHPTTAFLVVEVSDTTLSYDRNRKASLYARSNLADYWIVNLVDRQLEVHRNPVADASQPHGFRYATVTVLGPSDAVAPLAAPAAQVAVADLLP